MVAVFMDFLVWISAPFVTDRIGHPAAAGQTGEIFATRVAYFEESSAATRLP